MTEIVPAVSQFGDEDFVIIGQKMVGATGVVILMGKPIGSVGMREVMSTKGNSVNISLSLAPGYMKVRADTFDEAMAMIRNGFVAD